MLTCAAEAQNFVDSAYAYIPVDAVVLSLGEVVCRIRIEIFGEMDDVGGVGGVVEYQSLGFIIPGEPYLKCLPEIVLGILPEIMSTPGCSRTAGSGASDKGIDLSGGHSLLDGFVGLQADCRGGFFRLCRNRGLCRNWGLCRNRGLSGLGNGGWIRRVFTCGSENQRHNQKSNDTRFFQYPHRR